jgi:hypothetical protein
VALLGLSGKWELQISNMHKYMFTIIGWEQGISISKIETLRQGLIQSLTSVESAYKLAEEHGGKQEVLTICKRPGMAKEKARHSLIEEIWKD